MEINLKGKVALITGGTKGIGKETALMFADAGADVIICSRNQADIDAMKSEIQKKGVNAYGMVVDATKSKEVKKLFEEIVAKIGRLDILVNNVGSIQNFGGFMEVSEKDWKECYELNCLSVVYFAKEAIPYLQKSSQPRIINISTIAARQPGRFNPHYSAAKAAMLNLNKHLATAYAKDKILVNAICLGTVKTDIWKKSVENTKNFLGLTYEEAEKTFEEQEKAKNLLNKIGEPKDIANMILFLASDKAGWITGTAITIDGGCIKSIF